MDIVSMYIPVALRPTFSIISVHQLECAQVGTSLLFAYLYIRFYPPELVYSFSAYVFYILESAVPGHGSDSWTYVHRDIFV